MKTTLSLVALLLLFGCSESKTEEEKSTKIVTKMTTTQTPQEKVVEKEKKVVIKKTPVVEVTQKREVIQKKQIPKEIEKKSKQISKKVVTIIDGSKLFVKCASCHGPKAEKKALGKSQVIASWSVSKLTNAINGYQKGTYGGSMKGVMKPQVMKLSPAQVEALAKYISTL